MVASPWRAQAATRIFTAPCCHGVPVGCRHASRGTVLQRAGIIAMMAATFMQWGSTPWAYNSFGRRNICTRPVARVAVTRPSQLHTTQDNSELGLGMAGLEAHPARIVFVVAAIICSFIILPAISEAMTPEVSSSAVDWIDAKTLVSIASYGGVALIFIKNNLVDFNGPLAGVLGLERSVCTVVSIKLQTKTRALEIFEQLTGDAKVPALDEFRSLAQETSLVRGDVSELRTVYKGDGRADSQLEAAYFDENRALGVPHGPIETKSGFYIIWIVERTEV